MKKALVTIAGITAVTGVASQAYASEHHVQAGDTLWAIAQENGTSVDALKALNNLNSDLILVGQTLKVENTDTYTVKKGDTLHTIASQFDLTVNDIMSWNNLASDTIEVGTKLNLTAPVAKVQSETVQPVTQTEAPAQQTAAPAQQTAAPAQQTAAPVQQSYQAPAQQTAAPAQQTAAPAQQTAAPAQQTAAPAQQSYQAPAQQSYQAPAKSYKAPVNGNVAQIANGVASGKSYVYGANSATAVDCSAFAQQVLAAQGKSIPRTTYAQMAAGTRVSAPQAGDLVYFNGGSHVGVYIGNGQMIDALNPSEGIGQRSVSYVNGSVTGYYRF
ncbi:LysM peptidoglycan-binding domain-containing protein [Macrococcoides caseolyticum]|uniref:LysM peptidoglycan-binding domain-containing protein n=1 Tax=Macrococcoides caseolyticum TaxID=69966 RepID=UPI00105CB3E9|nr:LysM peptidoglycan-binding domain-containing protein [Macrococcus caseolyticus]TDM26952.1 LysM peptidoglycan-binding domain-containing protein [Macrococcus caseolyticus]